jgi:hypothetical protein
MMAEAMAQLRAQGHKDVEAPAGPQRWVRGVLRVHGREITIEVNSQQRLTRLLDLLRKVGGNPVLPPRSGSTQRRTSPGRPASAPLRAALRPQPKAGRSLAE